jgi:hypothetical protein
MLRPFSSFPSDGSDDAWCQVNVIEPLRMRYPNASEIPIAFEFVLIASIFHLSVVLVLLEDIPANSHSLCFMN